MNAYDDVPYPTDVQDQTHPDRMHVVGALFGLTPAPVDACRVLEVGCGTGRNLLSLAYCCPRSTFVGIDLAEHPVARGTHDIQKIGLSNISLHVRDLTQLDPDFGEFDYIIAHGLYAWVPEFVRDGLLRLCAQHLAPEGMAFISYNAMPGGHLRKLVRDLMLYHTRDIQDPDERVRQAENIVEFASKSTLQNDYYRVLLQHRLETMSGGYALFHDDLAECYEPVYFDQFIAHAERRGLTYVGEADFFEMSDTMYPANVRQSLDEFSRGDRIRREQYLDFLSNRGFRQTLLCRREAAPKEKASPKKIRSFHVSTLLTPTDVAGELAMPSGRKISTNHPVIQEKFARLRDLWPASLPVSDVTGGDPLLENYLFQLFASNFVRMESHAPYFTLEPGTHPEASPVARYQAIKGETLATLAQRAAQIEDETAKKFLLKLDGTRTRKQLAEEMERPMALIEQNLDGMARLALMVR